MFRNNIKLCFLTLALLSVFFGSEKCFATYVTLPAIADAGTKSQFPSNNFGSGNYMYNYYNASNRGRSFVKFDLSPIPANSTILMSFISVYNMANDGSDCNGDPGQFYVAMADADWSENTITWNNQPGSMGNLMSPIPCSTNGYVHLDTKYHIQQIVNGVKADHGFFIINEMGTNFLRTLMTRESINPPSLYVLYNAPTPTPTPTPTPDPGTTSNSNATTSGTISQVGISAGTKAAPAAKTSTAIKPPSELVAVNAANSTRAAVKLNWKISESTNIDGYKIFRSEQEKDGFANIALAEKGIAEFTDETVESGKTYYYFLRSYKGNTESESTATVSMTSSLPVQQTATAETKSNKINDDELYLLLGASLLLLASLLIYYELNWKKKLLPKKPQT